MRLPDPRPSPPRAGGGAGAEPAPPARCRAVPCVSVCVCLSVSRGVGGGHGLCTPPRCPRARRAPLAAPGRGSPSPSPRPRCRLPAPGSRRPALTGGSAPAAGPAAPPARPLPRCPAGCRLLPGPAKGGLCRWPYAFARLCSWGARGPEMGIGGGRGRGGAAWMRLLHPVSESRIAEQAWGPEDAVRNWQQH